MRQSQLWNKCAVRADSVHVRHAIVEVNVVIGVLLCGLLVGVRVVPVLLVMLYFSFTSFSWIKNCSHCGDVEVSVAIFLYLEV